MGDSEDDREAAIEVGCHFVGIALGEETRFSHPPQEPQITNLHQLQQIVAALHVKESQGKNTH